MKKRMIDNAMVERACKELSENWHNKWDTRNAMRAAVEAALNGPAAEPEIVVSMAMLNAVKKELTQWYTLHLDKMSQDYAMDTAIKIYRAMERARMKEANSGECQQPTRGCTISEDARKHERRGKGRAASWTLQRHLRSAVAWTNSDYFQT